jgi:hypothetical protein
MAESPEHQFLSDTFLSVLSNLSRSSLYAYRESERGKYDFSCLLAETWQCLVKGQTLWKHSEGIDKDLRTLLTASDVPLMAYVVSDTIKHRSALYEATQDYRRVAEGRLNFLKVFWVPVNFDADSEEDRRVVESLLRSKITEDILFNVLFGRLSAARVRATLMHLTLNTLGLELATLHSIAVDGFVSLNNLSERVAAHPSTLRDRVHRLQMSGLVLQERSGSQGYCVGSAGRTFLRLCQQVYDLVMNQQPLTSESAYVLRGLGIEPYEGDPPDPNYLNLRPDFNTPEAMFVMMIGKIVMSASQYDVDWRRFDYRVIPDEHDATRWLML